MRKEKLGIEWINFGRKTVSKNKPRLKEFKEILDYLDTNKYFCNRIVFDYDHYKFKEPYIELAKVEGIFSSDEVYYFKIPEILAYYARVHQGWTATGREAVKDEGQER